MNSYQQTDNHIALNIKPLEVVGGLFSNYNLDKIKIRPSQTLFELSAKEKKDLLIKRRCLTCACRLYQMRNGNWLCKSVKHRGNKIVLASTMAKYEEK